MTKKEENNTKNIDKKAKKKAQNPLREKNEKLLSEIENLKKDFADLKEKSIRILADSENSKKRHQIELDKTRKYALFTFVSELVEFVENFHLLKSNKPNIDDKKSVEGFVEGLELSSKNLEKILEKYHIKRISPNEGDEFNHDFHEAIARAETQKDDLNDKIKKVIKSGYMVNDRIISAALVEVYYK